jgi:hypothetical protein
MSIVWACVEYRLEQKHKLIVLLFQNKRYKLLKY